MMFAADKGIVGQRWREDLLGGLHDGMHILCGQEVPLPTGVSLLVDSQSHMRGALVPPRGGASPL